MKWLIGSRSILYLSVLLAGLETALGCSFEGTPSAAETIALAEEILLVTAVEEVNRGCNEDEMACIRFEVIETVKAANDMLRSELRFPGYFSASPVVRMLPPEPASIPYNNAETNRRGLGECFAVEYVKGEMYLVMLRNGSPYWAIMGPTSYLVSGEDDPWMWWVKGYLAGNRAISSD